MSEVEYVSASDKVYVAPEDVKDMIGAILTVHDRTMVKRLIDKDVDNKVHYLFQDVHDKAPAGTYTEL